MSEVYEILTSLAEPKEESAISEVGLRRAFQWLLSSELLGVEGSLVEAEAMLGLYAELSFNYAGSQFSLYCSDSLLSFLAAKRLEREPLLLDTRPTEEELTVFVELVLEVLSKIYRTQNIRIMLASISLQGSEGHKHRKANLQFGVEQFGVGWSVPKKLTGVLSNYGKKEIFQKRLSQYSKSINAELPLEFEFQLTSLLALGSMTEGEVLRVPRQARLGGEPVQLSVQQDLLIIEKENEREY